MNIFHLIIPAYISCTNQMFFYKITDDLINKVENREYGIFNSFKIPVIVYLVHHESKQIINVNINEKASQVNNQIKKRCTVFYDKKSINEITNEIENLIVSSLKFKNSYSINITYDKLDIKRSSIFYEVMKNIINVNKEKKINKKCKDIFYDNICEKNSYFIDVIYTIKQENINLKDNMSIFKVHVFYNIEPSTWYIRLPIEIEGIYYLFELDIEEFELEAFYSLSNINIKFKNSYEEQNFMNLLIFLKEIDDKLLCSQIQQSKVSCKTNKYMIKNSSFKIQIESDKINFRQRSDNYEYNLLENASFSINRNCYFELQRFVEQFNIMNINQIYEGIEVLFRSFCRNKKIEFLVHRILYRKKSALNLLFGHLFLSMYVIYRHELDIIIGHKEDTENEIEDIKNRLTDFILSKISFDNNLIFYLIKICLLKEAEKYINENEVNDDLLFNTLKEIGNLVRLKKSNSNEIMQFSCDKGGIDIFAIITDVLNIHTENLYNYKIWGLEHICKLASLFEVRYKLSTAEYSKDFEKYEIMDSMELYKFDVEFNIGILLNKICRNHKEDKSYKNVISTKEIETNKIKKKLETIGLIKCLNLLISEALDQEIENIWEKETRVEFEDDLITKGIEKIDQIFARHFMVKSNTIINYFKKIFIKNIGEDTILEYKNELENNFRLDISINIEKNAINKAKKNLKKILKILAENNFENMTKEKEKYGKDLKSILKFLNKEDPMEVLNNNPEYKTMIIYMN
ncbi:uncharacterized protein VNE69_02216 [Vairimorpha necatrix]|uniref:Uncharacterized protein n=1 Tax=Vairimorpha necatrix TaxID=6039 RepID=A0AAX4J9S5_9MICR